MPIDPDRPAGGPRRVKGPGRPPPWVTRGGGGTRRQDRNDTRSDTRSDNRSENRPDFQNNHRGSNPREDSSDSSSESIPPGGLRGFRDSRTRRAIREAEKTGRGGRGNTANHSGSFYGGVRRGRGGGDGGARVQTRRGVALEAKGLRWIISRRGTGSRLGAAGS